MDRLQEINEYINDMKIKKAFFGGYDKEDVYKKIGVIVDLFRKFTEEQQEKQKELLNTIKMEPILETTVMEEETMVTKKKKMMEITDYILLGLIITFIIIFILVLFKLK